MGREGGREGEDRIKKGKMGKEREGDREKKKNIHSWTYIHSSYSMSSQALSYEQEVCGLCPWLVVITINKLIWDVVGWQHINPHTTSNDKSLTHNLLYYGCTLY